MHEPLSLLKGHQLFHSGDLDYVRGRVERIFCPHRLELVGRGASLDAWMRTKWLRSIGIVVVGYGSEVLIEPRPLKDFFVVMIPLTGHSLVRSGNEEIESHPGLATIPNPDQPLSMRWSADCVKLIVRIERSVLEAFLSEHLGYLLDHGPINFRLGMDVTTGYGAGWADIARSIARDLDGTPSLFSDAFLARSWEQSLMLSLFRAQSSDYDFSAPEPLHIASQRHVSAAVAVLRQRVDEPWTIESLARHVGVGKRTLQAAFHEAGKTFTGELLEARLRKAHNILRDGMPGSVKVTNVFARCGLHHHGRASGQYRQRFGESPKETLRSYNATDAQSSRS